MSDPGPGLVHQYRVYATCYHPDPDEDLTELPPRPASSIEPQHAWNAYGFANPIAHKELCARCTAALRPASERFERAFELAAAWDVDGIPRFPQLPRGLQTALTMGEDCIMFGFARDCRTACRRDAEWTGSWPAGLFGLRMRVWAALAGALWQAARVTRPWELRWELRSWLRRFGAALAGVDEEEGVPLVGDEGVPWALGGAGRVEVDWWAELRPLLYQSRSRAHGGDRGQRPEKELEKESEKELKESKSDSEKESKSELEATPESKPEKSESASASASASASESESASALKSESSSAESESESASEEAYEASEEAKRFQDVIAVAKAIRDNVAALVPRDCHAYGVEPVPLDEAELERRIAGEEGRAREVLGDVWFEDGEEGGQGEEEY